MSAAPTCCQYRPKDAFLSPLWRIVSDHLDNFLRHYERRYQSTHGRLAPYVEKVLNQFLLCGDPNQGVTLFTCKECKISLAVPFSCKTRICPSCMSRRAEDLSEGLGEALPRVPYRHVVITLPRLMGIRHRIRETPGLMRRVTRLAVGVLSRYLVRQVKDPSSRQARPGFVVAWQTFGDNLTYHPHLHILVTDGVFLPDGNFHGYLEWDPTQLTCLLRQSVLKSFGKLNLVSPEASETMLSWPIERSGFNVHVDTRVDDDDRDRLKTLLRYLTRPPVTMDRLHYTESSGQVRYRTRKGAELHYLHAIDFLADLTQHVPPPRRQTVSYHGHFANALGTLERRSEPKTAKSTSLPCPRRAAWSRLVLRVWQVDPELCPRCGSRMQRSRALIVRLELNRLLKSLSIGCYPVRPPPAAVPETAPVTYGSVGKRSKPRPIPSENSAPPDVETESVPLEPEWEVSQVPPDGWDEWAAAS